MWNEKFYLHCIMLYNGGKGSKIKNEHWEGKTTFM
jgi:hypothetical protein